MSLRPVVKNSRRVKKRPAHPGDNSRPPAEQVTASNGSQQTVRLGPEVDIAGSVYIDAAVVLEGFIDGEIRCSELELGAQGKVRGRIVADRVTIFGTVTDGAIYASVLNLRPGCRVEAEIYHEHLQLDQGSYFDGKSRHITDPAALAPA